MPFTIIARVTRGNYEVLLQRRAVPGGSEWGVPGGDYLPDESGLRVYASTLGSGTSVRELRELISRRAAVREVIEKAGGGSCGTARGVTETLCGVSYTMSSPVSLSSCSSSPVSLAAKTFRSVLLPPTLLKMVENPTYCRTMSLSRGGKDVYVYLIHPQREAVYSQSWVPRACTAFRNEDEKYVNSSGCKYGYVWRPLSSLSGMLECPVPRSNEQMAPWLRPFFCGEELRLHLVDLAKALGVVGAPTYASGVISPRNISPRTRPQAMNGSPTLPTPPAPPAAAAPQSKLCRVASCADCPPDTTHFCQMCGDKDSTHPATDCPECKVIFFIRHGQSTANVAAHGTRHLHPDPLLTPTGLSQAAKLNGVTNTFSVETVVSSPLRRAIQTANIAFSGQPVPHIITPVLREISLKGDPEEAHHPDNRGRPNSKLSTFIDECISQQRGPTVDHESVQAIDNRQHELWQPEAEDTGAQSRRYVDGRVIDESIQWLLNRPERVLGVVSHWTLLNRILSVDARNCRAYRVTIHPGSKRLLIMMQDNGREDWKGGWVQWSAEAEQIMTQEEKEVQV